MSELNTIKNTYLPITVKSLCDDLNKIGIEEEDIVLIHSSLSSIGWVCGGETAVLEALIKTIGENGTISMPAHSGGNSDPADWVNPPVPKEWIELIYNNMPAFHPDITPTRGMGRIAELFRTYPGTLRSNHPHTSFCARGKYAKQIVKDHDLTPQFGSNSPLGKLYQLNAKVLLLGVGYGNCTCFHMGEVISGRVDKARQGAAMATDGCTREWVWFDDYDYNCDDFPLLGKEFESFGKVRTGKIGNADCRLFYLKEGVDYAVQWLKENRNMLQ